MKKQIFLTMLVTLFLASNTLYAKKWALLPVLDKDFHFNFTVAGTVAQVNSNDNSASVKTIVNGAQLSFNCPWFDVGVGDLRTHFNYSQYFVSGNTVNNFELNPHWYLGNGLTIGAGPGLGYLWAVDNQYMWAVQAFADIEYRIGLLFMGIGARYQWTENKAMGTYITDGMNNFTVLGKIGINLF